MGVELGLDERGQQVVRRVDVVVDRVALVPRRSSSSTARRAARRSARRRRAAARASSVAAGRRSPAATSSWWKPISRPVSLLPGREPLRRAGGSASATRARSSTSALRRAKLSTIVDVVPAGRQVQRRGPAAEAVAAEDQDLAERPPRQLWSVRVRSCSMPARPAARAVPTASSTASSATIVTSRSVTAPAAASPCGKRAREQPDVDELAHADAAGGDDHDQPGRPGDAGRAGDGSGSCQPDTAACTSTAAHDVGGEARRGS